jgi:uncharacterized protein
LIWRSSAFALLALLLSGCSSARVAGSGAPVGHWEGVASFRGRSVAVALDFSNTDDSLRGAFSSDDLMITRVRVTSARFVAPHLHFVIADPEAPLVFEGSVRGDSLIGELASAGFPSGPGPAPSLALHRAPAARASMRTREVSIAGRGVQLAGTVFLPAGTGKHPGVVLLQGSTLNTRDHYLYYAERFARAGFVVLAFDKRGSGASSGVLRTASYDDLVADAASTIHFVASQPEVDATRVGVWGLSQGAFLAPRIAETSRAAFIVAISPPVEPIAEVAAWQDSGHVREAGFDANDAHHAADVMRRLAVWAAGNESDDVAARLIASVVHEPWANRVALPRVVPPELERRGWYWAERSLDPWPWWQVSRVPALAVYGGRDDLVPAGRSSTRLAPLLAARRDSVSRVIVYPKANHEIRIVPSGSEPFDWPRAPADYLPTVIRWMRARAGLDSTS